MIIAPGTINATRIRNSKTSDPLNWWRENEARFYGLKRLARKYLAIPATPAPSERVSSLAGKTVVDGLPAYLLII